jgi:predicted ribosome quality control (RQC) complex YloA/Tae2 family protein
LADSEAILREIELELTNEGYLKRKPSPTSKKSQTTAGPSRYVSRDGITILVGRNNQQNDQLTFRLTQPNHLWLHARNIPGSHVAILHEGDVPPETLLQAASLAAYYSQSRKSPKVPVDYTLRKHVRKPKGASPGFVHYDGAKTILVNPTDFPMPKQL